MLHDLRGAKGTLGRFDQESMSDITSRFGFTHQKGNMQLAKVEKISRNVQ